MNKLGETIETVASQEVLKKQGDSVSVEQKHEDISAQMLEQEKVQVAEFQAEGVADLAPLESRAAEEEFVIKPKDATALQEVDAGALDAETTLKSEIIGENKVEKIPTKEQQEAFDEGKEMALKLKSEGNDTSPEYWALYSHLTEGLGADIQWRNAGDIDAEKVKKMLDAKFPQKDQIVTRSCPKCGGEYTGTNASYCTACGADLELNQPEGGSEMKERVVKKPELLSAKEASKELLAEERLKLAQEIREQRKTQGGRLSRLNAIVEAGQERMEGENADEQFGKISGMQGAEATSMAERLSHEELDEQGAQEERENMSQLIASSEGISALRKKLEEHYAKADEIAKKKFESIRKRVEQISIRNDSFIVHAIIQGGVQRHNENSNINANATLEDDIDMLLSLEPTISASSVTRGSEHGLWGGNVGVILGGGDIKGVALGDNGTKPDGIKGERSGDRSTAEQIDKSISNRKSNDSYNELTVNNPEVFGFYKLVQYDNEGRIAGFTKKNSGEDNQEEVRKFMLPLTHASERGLPLLVMTPDRKLFEFKTIGADGVVHVGDELTPEKVALGNAGMVAEKRREIGNNVVSKYLFKHAEDQKEAKQIIEGLEGKESLSEDLSKEEYIEYIKNNPGQFYELPEHLRDDKEFMMEAAQYNPRDAYQKSGDTLKKDIEFIKFIYNLRKGESNIEIHSSMPDELRENQDVALMAIENDDYDYLESSFAENPLVWKKIIDKKIEGADPDKWFSRKVGEDEFSQPSFYVGKGYDRISLTEKLVADQSFIDGLNEKYPKYRFEGGYNDRMLVTKLV